MDKIKYFQDFVLQNRREEKSLAISLIKDIFEDKLEIIDEITDIILDWQDEGITFKWEAYYFFQGGKVGIFGNDKRIESKEISEDIIEKVCQFEVKYLIDLLKYFESNGVRMEIYLWLDHDKRSLVEKSKSYISERCEKSNIKVSHTKGWGGLKIEI